MRRNVSLRQRMGELFWHHCQRIRIAVIGAQESGKTVFLESLINHLLKADFTDDIGGWKLSVGTEILSPKCAGSIEPFDNNRYRMIYDALLRNENGDKGSVPPSTLKTFLLQMKVSLGLQKGGVNKNKKVLLEVLDVPGERVADFSMFNRSFREWCREITRSHQMAPGGRTSFDAYMEKASEAKTVDDIKKAFYEYVDDRYNCNSTLIYPSAILLDLDGKNKVKELDLATNPFFNGEGFFAPIPESFFQDKGRRDIVASFAKAYKRYCDKSGLKEVCGWLETANKVYYLLDVFSILMSGKTRENDMRSHIAESLKMFGSREQNIIMRAYNGVVDYLMRSRAEEIYLVGTQIDRASKIKRNNIEKLLRNEFGSILKMPALAGKHCDVLTCAAIRFGQDDGDENIEMSYKLTPHNSETYELRKYSNDVPEHFPDDYKYVADPKDPRRRRYAYPYSQPRFGGDARKIYDHVDFNNVVRTIFVAHRAQGKN